jgi:hypothetical protein
MQACRIERDLKIKMHEGQVEMHDLDIKAFVAALALRSPKERAAAWRRLTAEQCAAAWSLLTPQQRKADGEALATAWIEDADDPATRRDRKAHITAARNLAAKGLLVEIGRRDGQVVSASAAHLPPEALDSLLEGPVKHRAFGANAFYRGRSITDNPHPADTSEYQDWDFGFRAARTVTNNNVAAGKTERLH